DLLAFFQQIADGRQPARLVMAASAHGASSWTASAATIAPPVSALRLLIAGSAGRGTLFGARAFQAFTLGFGFSLNGVQHFVVIFAFFSDAKIVSIFSPGGFQTLSLVLSGGALVDVGITDSFGQFAPRRHQLVRS